LSSLHRAGQWFLNSGIQESTGGVARYYLADTQMNRPVSAEITGYAASTFVYLHSLTRAAIYLDRAVEAAHFLTRTAWDRSLGTIPFESEQPLAYFFDCGIIARGLLSVWRETRETEFLEVAKGCGRSMAEDFAAPGGEFHPILHLPGKTPVPRGGSWSRSPGCYQLKAAMGWYDLYEATGERRLETWYHHVLDDSLATYASFLPGDPDPDRVMDRIHAYCYFLEGLLPCAHQKRCAVALCDGIRRIAGYLGQSEPSFVRSDVYAQLLRLRIIADRAGIVPLDHSAAEIEARNLQKFQRDDPDPRIHGGFFFGRQGTELLPYVNPVSTAFGLQALCMWEQFRAGEPPLHRHFLI